MFALSLFTLILSENKTQSSSTKLISNQRVSDPNDIAYQISILNHSTPLTFKYDSSVQYYIDLFRNERSDQFREMLCRSEYYFPIIETYLDKYNLPLELKYLAIVESGLNPTAKSKSGAMGIWQFVYNTCNLVGLQVNSYVDERCNVHKSTIAACKYFEYLYRTFGNWELAMAAYNAGPGAVEKALLENNGVGDFWELCTKLPEQTQKYIPAITAIAYLFNQYDYNPCKFANKLRYRDTIVVNTQIDLIQYATENNIALQLLVELNPQYRKGLIPQIAGENFCLTIPKGNLYIQNNYTGSLPVIESAHLENITYRVQPGDFLRKIALENFCTVQEIITWNNMDSSLIHPGQEIILRKPKK